MILPVNGKISSVYDEPRPLTGKKTHIHGAVDIAAPVGEKIRAPERGLLYYFQIVRNGDGQYWDEFLWDGEPFPFRNYFYDMFGSVILLVGDSGLWHVMTHSYWNQLYNAGVISRSEFDYKEQRKDDRFPIFAYHNLGAGKKVYPGAIIGAVGNAGYSTGPHVHYEVHKGKWQEHEDRMNPLEVIKL